MIRRHLDRRQNRPFRFLESERRKNWWLPAIAAGLALFLMWHEARAAEIVRGLDGKGSAYVCQRNVSKQLIEFCVVFTKERR